MNEELLDTSHWQGKRKLEDVQLQKSRGIVGVWQKVTQDVSYKDDTRDNLILYDQEQMPSGGYHFVGLGTASSQFANFTAAVGKLPMRLPPAMDCEGFTTLYGVAYSVRDVRYMLNSPDPRHLAVSRALLVTAKGVNVRRLLKAADKVGQLERAVKSTLGLTYPVEKTIKDLGDLLIEWMEPQECFEGFPYPLVYTNKSSGDRIFKTKACAKFPPWIANWGVSQNKIAFPNVYVGAKYMAWQYTVANGAPFGIDGQVDRDKWGNHTPFPTVGPTPPPPVRTAKSTVELDDGRIFQGTIPQTK